MKRYRVVLEKIVEEEIEIDAESEDEAVQLAATGVGGLVTHTFEFVPAVVYSEEVPGYYVTD